MRRCRSTLAEAIHPAFTDFGEIDRRLVDMRPFSYNWPEMAAMEGQSLPGLTYNGATLGELDLFSPLPALNETSSFGSAIHP